VKALITIILLILGITILPIFHARSGWAKFQANTYVERDNRLHEQNPKIIAYEFMEKFAIGNQRPEQQAVSVQVKPMVKLPIAALKNQILSAKDLPEDDYILMAIVPASGSDRTLVKDSEGQYWGPVVRIAFAQTQKPPLPEPVTPMLVSTSVPQPPTTDAELAYNALADKDFTKARSLFARAIATDPRPQWIADSRPLSKWLSIQSGVTYRNAAPNIATSQALLGQGGSWFDAAVRVNGNPDRPLALVGFVYGAQNRRQYGINPNSLQAGFGLRWNPVKTVTVEAIRLQKLGNQSRNDWMLRAGAGTGVWRPADIAQMRWLHWQARADAAVIGFSRRDIFAQADARIGLGLRLSDELSLTPYIGSTATLQKDIRTASLIEASSGLWLHRSSKLPLDARLEYRYKIAGSAAASNGAAVTLSFGF
jgi:hypothetical protein